MRRHQRPVKFDVRQKAYDRQNREAAVVILADPDRYGGPASGLVQWAGTIMRQCPPIEPSKPRAHQAPLFQEDSNAA